MFEWTQSRVIKVGVCCWLHWLSTVVWHAFDDLFQSQKNLVVHANCCLCSPRLNISIHLDDYSSHHICMQSSLSGLKTSLRPLRTKALLRSSLNFLPSRCAWPGQTHAVVEVQQRSVRSRKNRLEVKVLSTDKVLSSRHPLRG